MADTKRELQEALHRFVGDRVSPTMMIGKVGEIDLNTRTCSVKVNGDFTIYDVRMRAAIDGVMEGFVVVPKPNSWVIIGNIDKSDGDYCIVAVSSVYRIDAKVGNKSIALSSSGFLVKDEVVGSLKSAIGELIDQIKLITVNAAGVPTTTPLNFAAFDVIKLKLNQILSDA